MLVFSAVTVDAAFFGGVSARPRRSSPSMVIGEQAASFGPATLIRKLKTDLPQFPWLAEGDGNPNNKIDMPDHVKQARETASFKYLAHSSARAAIRRSRALLSPFILFGA